MTTMLADIFAFIKAHWVLLGVFLTVGHLFKNKHQKGLNQYPGPALAAFTNLWRMNVVRSWAPEKVHIALHRKYGDVVRLGPSVLSFGTAAALKDIYGLNKGFVKVISNRAALYFAAINPRTVRLLPNSERSSKRENIAFSLCHN